MPKQNKVQTYLPRLDMSQKVIQFFLDKVETYICKNTYNTNITFGP